MKKHGIELAVQKPNGHLMFVDEPQKRANKRKLENSCEKKLKQSSILNFISNSPAEKIESDDFIGFVPNPKVLGECFDFRQQERNDLLISDVESTVSDATSNSIESCKENRKSSQRKRSIPQKFVPVIEEPRKKKSLSLNASVELVPPPPKKQKMEILKDTFEVEAIVDYSVIRSKMVFNIKWENYPPSDNTWEPLENIRECDIFRTWFEKEFADNKERIEAMKVTLNDELKEKIDEMRTKSKKEISSLLCWEFDELEFNCEFLLYIYLRNENVLDKRFGERFLKQFVLFHFFEMQEEQRKKLNDFLTNIRNLEESCTIRIENNVDFHGPPENFTYINKHVLSEGIEIPEEPLVGCDCTESCQTNKNCCPLQADSKFAYELTKSGKKVLKLKTRRDIYECNKLCACGEDCLNRVVQNGIRIPLCLFKTSDKGWGVKAVTKIIKGSFICEYIGEIINYEEAERRGQIYDEIGRNYLFDLDFHRSEDEAFTVDAYKYGNLARFINHSCEPNCTIWPAYVEHLDHRFPKLAFFTNRTIEADEELSFDYAGGERTSPDEGSNDTGDDGQPKNRETCRCGAPSCRKIIFKL